MSQLKSILKAPAGPVMSSRRGHRVTMSPKRKVRYFIKGSEQPLSPTALEAAKKDLTVRPMTKAPRKSPARKRARGSPKRPRKSPARRSPKRASPARKKGNK